LICGLSSNFGDFTWLKFSSQNPLSPVLKEQKLFSPNGSAFAQRYYTRRVNRMLIEGCPSGFCASAALNDLNHFKRDVNPFRKIATQKPDGHPSSKGQALQFACGLDFLSN